MSDEKLTEAHPLSEGLRGLARNPHPMRMILERELINAAAELDQLSRRLSRLIKTRDTICHWRDVRDELPPVMSHESIGGLESEQLLMVWKGMVTIGFFVRYEDSDYWANDNGIICDDVTHWAPLPKGPLFLAG